MKLQYGATGALLLLAACTSLNPNYGKGGGPGGIGGGGDAADLSSGSGRDAGALPQPDLSTPVCTDGQRQCLANTGSAICTNGQFALDRACPVNSACKDGYCQAPSSTGLPPSGQSCDFGQGPAENNCFGQIADNGLSCEPFITDPGQMTVAWICGKIVGPGLPGAHCKTGDQCRTGFCGSNGTCFRTCTNDMECPQSSGGNMLQCQDVSITVEGVQLTKKSCIP